MTGSLPIQIAQRAEAYIELLANHDRPAVFVDLKDAISALRSKKDLLYWSL